MSRRAPSSVSVVDHTLYTQRMLTKIIPRTAQPYKGPTTALDHLIWDVLQRRAGGQEPKAIWVNLGSTEYSLQQVHARLRVLRERGALLRKDNPGGPRRGPGAGVYFINDHQDSPGRQ